MKDYAVPDEPGAQGELELIQQAAQGDHEAFRSLVISYEGKLLVYLTQMLGDIDNARDIAQETFIAIFHALPRWQAPAASTWNVDEEQKHPLAPWLYRIATNRALSLIRKRTIQRRVHAEPAHQNEDDEQTEGRLTAMMTECQPSFEERYIARELLSQALAHLSEDDAACLVLHYISGERYGEIAARLGLSSEAVRKRVSRGLTALRKAYFALDTEVRL